MFTRAGIFVILVFAAVALPDPALGQQFPYPPNITTCEKFEISAQFNPYALIDSMWKIFYFWSNNTEINPIVFSLAGKTRVKKFREVYETVSGDTDLEWEKATLFMSPKPGVEVLFIFAGTPGAFRAVVKREQRNKERPIPHPLISYADVRMKLVERYLGMMCCEDLTAYAMARVMEVPKTEDKCLKAASSIGYQGYDGRSYLSIMNSNNDEF